MNKKIRIVLVLAVIIAIVLLAMNYFSHHTVAVLQPRGPIALKERNLMITAFLMMLIVVIPVFVLTFVIVYKYREGHKGKYKPEFDHSRLIESIWWLIPSILILVLAVITWNATYALNPYTALKGEKNPPITIEAVALDWKWLFIYPKQHIASVNLVQFPVNSAVTFYLTADAPMNSFWVPQLSGQIYAMPGMSTQLNLAASSTGNFYGSSANISGVGFAGMHFDARASTVQQFNKWVAGVKASSTALNTRTYALLDQPSIDNPVTYYNNANGTLYNYIIDKYMAPGSQMTGMVGMQ